MDLKKTVAIHQPNFLPFLGFIYKIINCDIFVFLDDVQFEKNLYGNRVEIKNKKGKHWLTCPIHFHSKSKTNEITLAAWHEEKDRVIRTIEMDYKRSPNFTEYFPELADIIGRDWVSMASLNSVLVMWLASKWGASPKYEFSSQLKVEGEGDDRLINICKLFGADYLSGQGGKKYMEEAKFKENGVGLKYSEFKHPVYEQLWGDFIPNLSAIDFLFNVGPKNLKGGSMNVDI